MPKWDVLLMLARVSGLLQAILLPSRKTQLSFTDPVQMFLLLSAGVATCTKETEPEECPTGRGEGQAGQASFAQYCHRGTDRSGVCSQWFYPLKECCC